MNEKSVRIRDPNKTPSPARIKIWLGEEVYGYWNRMIQWIDQNYADIFTPDRIFGGKKHGLNKLDSRFPGNDGPFSKPYCMERLYL
jgi:hypothetical protein